MSVLFENITSKIRVVLQEVPYKMYIHIHSFIIQQSKFKSLENHKHFIYKLGIHFKTLRYINGGVKIWKQTAMKYF